MCAVVSTNYIGGRLVPGVKTRKPETAPDATIPDLNGPPVSANPPGDEAGSDPPTTPRSESAPSHAQTGGLDEFGSFFE